MGLKVIIGGTDERDLATGKGWDDFCKFCDDLSLDKYEEIIRFSEHGLSQELDDLKSQLVLARKSENPDADIAEVMDGLIVSLDERPSGAKSAFVSNGMSESGDDDSDEDDWHSEFDENLAEDSDDSDSTSPKSTETTVKSQNSQMELIRSIKTRKSADQFGYGIGLASNYLESLQTCLKDEACFKRMMNGVNPSQWEMALKNAATMLTYSQMTEEEHEITKETSVASMKAILSEITGDTPNLPKHCAMVFRNYVTTIDMDHDRDIIEPMGADVDKSMPLLWQHLQPSPIGKLLGVIDQNSNFLKVASCICDVNDLAADSIKMVEAGILRISHGFKPKRFEPLASQPGEQMPAGFRVKACSIVEESLVSVPSNSKAVIDSWSTLISRKSLKAELVKSFGQSYYEMRDTAHSDAGHNNRPSIEVIVKHVGADGIVIKSSDDGHACGCGMKDNGSCGCSLGGKAVADLKGKPNPGATGEPNPEVEDSTDDVAEDGTQKGGSKSATSECKKCGSKCDDTGTCKECGYVSGGSDHGKSITNLRELKSKLVELSFSADGNDLKDLRDIVNIAKGSLDSVERRNEMRQLEEELSAIG